MRRFLLLFCFISSFLHSSEGVYFSDKPKLFSPMLASSRDPQVKMSFLSNEHGKFFEPAVGGDLGIYYKDMGSEENENKKISLVARVMIAPRFEFGSGSFDLWNTDFLGGPQLTYRWVENGLEIWPYHESSHKGPDVAVRTGPGVNYSFESLRILYTRFLLPELRIYSGAEGVVRGDPKNVNAKLSFRLGGDWHILKVDPSLYVAADFESKQVQGWTVNSSLQVGYELGAVDVQRKQHIFVNFFHGYSPQGQFYKDRETTLSFGIAMTL